MKLIRFLIVVALIFTGLTFMGGSVSAYNMAKYIYPLEQGNWWTYNNTFNMTGGPSDVNETYTLKKVVNGTESINGVETTRLDYMIEDSIDSYWCLVMDSEAFKLYKEYQSQPVPGGVYYIYDPPLVYFPAKFDVGESYEGPISMSVYAASNDEFLELSTGSETVTFEAVEDVTVQGRTYRNCLSVASSFFYQSPAVTVAHEDTTWYARNIGIVKQEITLDWKNPAGDFVITSSYELTDYNVCPMSLALRGDSKKLNTLRKFRDEVLSKTPAGREVIKLYYQWSPVIVKAMTEDEEFKEELKEMIEGILPMIR